MKVPAMARQDRKRELPCDEDAGSNPVYGFMQMCQEHWDACQKAIETRGLNHLVSKDGEELLNRMVNDLEGKSTKADYDPLMDLNMMITTEALRCGGLYLLAEKEDGTQFCPLCEAALHGETPQEWIDGASDAILQHCKEQGMQG